MTRECSKYTKNAVIYKSLYMPPRRDQDYLNVDSASDDSIDEDYNGVRNKKGKGKAIDRRKKEKGKGKVNEVT